MDHFEVNQKNGWLGKTKQTNKKQGILLTFLTYLTCSHYTASLLLLLLKEAY